MKFATFEGLENFSGGSPSTFPLAMSGVQI